MKCRFSTRAALQLVVLPALVLVAAMAGRASGQTGNVGTPRAWDGKPDLNGIWQAMNTANWDLEAHPARPGHPDTGAVGAMPPGRSVVVGGSIPYQPAALEQKKKNFEDRLQADPEAKCFMPGVPRANYMPYPFQIVQGNQKIMMVYGFAEASRTIHMDKDKPEPAPIDTWMGRSHGRWDGDTLVVEAAGFNGEAWFDRSGNFASSALKVTERYRLIGPNTIDYEATMEDPSVFTKPWTIKMLLYRHLDPGARVIEFKCVEFSEDLLYGHLRKVPTRPPPSK